MYRKLTVLLALLAAMAFAISACGGDDDDGSETTAVEETTTAEETTAAEGGGGSGSVSAVAITADPGGELAYEESSVDASAGTVEIDFDNPSATGHDVRVESPDGEDLGGTDIITESTTAAEVEAPDPGTYTFYCSVPGHREAGMEGDLNVE